MGKSDYLENEVLKWVASKSSIFDGAPPAHYLGLLLTMPSADSGAGLVEVSGGGYARQTIVAKFADPGNGVMVSNAAIAFAVPSAPWGPVVGWGIWDALTTGNLLRYGSLTTGKTIGTGDQATFASGGITLRED